MVKIYKFCKRYCVSIYVNLLNRTDSCIYMYTTILNIEDCWLPQIRSELTYHVKLLCTYQHSSLKAINICFILLLLTISQVIWNFSTRYFNASFLFLQTYLPNLIHSYVVPVINCKKSKTTSFEKTCVFHMM